MPEAANSTCRNKTENAAPQPPSKIQTDPNTMPNFLKPLLILLTCAFAPLQAQQQHTAESPTIIEGPQAPGTPPGPAPARSVSGEPTLMSNDTVLRMHTAGLSDDLILQTIAAQPGQYDTTPDSLIGLKQSGLSDPILSAMANKARRQITNRSTLDAPVVLSPVNEIGVYYKDPHGAWIPMDSEIVHIKSGGFLKSMATHNIIKEDHNGVVTGTEATLILPRPIDFLLYTPDGVDASEYELVRFRLNSKDREFRVLTGGVIHSTGGAQRDDVPIHPVKTAPRTWTFTLPADIPGAEYGILPPGTGNVTNGGKIYTFAIVEPK